MKAIVNATPLIALALIDRLHILTEMFDEIIVPAAVYDEVVLQGAGKPGANKIASRNWTIKRPEIQPGVDLRLFGLDAGETEVLLLARQLQPDWVIIDERLARRVALALGLPLKGTLGLLLSAVQTGLVDQEDAIADVQRLTRNGIRISASLQAWFEKEVRSSITFK